MSKHLLDAYPHCPHAIAFVELILCEQGTERENSDEPTSWDLLWEAGWRDPNKYRDIIRECLADEVRDGSPGKHREALAEVDHPSFMQYLAAKLGML